MYSIEEMMKRREQEEAEFNQMLAGLDGSHAHNLEAVFVGGKLHGQVFDHDALMQMGNGQFTPRWSSLKTHNPLTVNLDLEDQPMIDGYLSPMCDGGRLRYETQEVYDMMFD